MSDDPVTDLSPTRWREARQRAVRKLRAEGLSVRAIGERINVAPSTVMHDISPTPVPDDAEDDSQDRSADLVVAHTVMSHPAPATVVGVNRGQRKPRKVDDLPSRKQAG